MHTKLISPHLLITCLSCGWRRSKNRHQEPVALEVPWALDPRPRTCNRATYPEVLCLSATENVVDEAWGALFSQDTWVALQRHAAKTNTALLLRALSPRGITFAVQVPAQPFHKNG